MDQRASAFVAAWTEWRRERIRWVTAPHGPAALIAHNWLTETPAPQLQAPGEWRASGATAIGTGLSRFLLGPSATTLERREEWVIEEGGLLTDGILGFGLFVREGDVALRVFDPDSLTRARLRSLAAFAPDPAWSLPGRFTPATADNHIEVQTVDGRVRDSTYDGTIDLVLPQSGAVSLSVTRSGSGLRAVFGDGTNGSETFRFRFLDLPAPAADGSITVDFNRAYLPPCAFADDFVCPFPSAGNRLAVAVRAGERAVVLEDGTESISGLG